MKLRSGLLVSIAALALCACASMGTRPAAPDVRLQALTAGAIDGSGAHARLHFAVRNPNAYALGVKNFDYQVRLDDRDVGSGALAQPVILEADAVTALDVDVRMDLRVMSAALDHAVRKGTLAYDVAGVLVLDSGMTLPFRKHGVLDTPNGLR
ncbi:MAG: LEA type 2 family protein [Casimicrobiaceae bacterium]